MLVDAFKAQKPNREGAESTALVDLLVEHWGDIPEAFQEQLGLRLGLVRA
ncbi:MAG: hypothetical protein IT373_06910 [Polyangiaceae bacterium]|nr:hypothetical protein [Polyangiaceae bacterium]